MKTTNSLLEPLHTDDSLSLEKESGLEFPLRSQGTSIYDEIFLIPHMAHVLERARAQGSQEGEVPAQAQLPV